MDMISVFKLNVLLNIMKVHQIALTVNDIGKSVSFYSKLGFKQKAYVKRDDGREKAILNSSGFELELFSSDNPYPSPIPQDLEQDMKTIGIKHISLMVDDVETTYMRLRKEVEFIGKPEESSTGGKYVFFKDPDGIVLEFYQE